MFSDSSPGRGSTPLAWGGGLKVSRVWISTEFTIRNVWTASQELVISTASLNKQNKLRRRARKDRPITMKLELFLALHVA